MHSWFKDSAKYGAKLAFDYAWTGVKSQLNLQMFDFGWAVALKVFITCLLEFAFLAIRLTLSYLFKIIRKWVLAIFSVRSRYQKLRYPQNENIDEKDKGYILFS